MRKIVVDMQNFLFADSIATAFRNSDYEIDVIRTESPKDTVELCQVYKPFVLIMEVTGYTPWNLCERLKLRDEVKKMCPHCKIALIVDSNTERQAAIDIRDAKDPTWRDIVYAALHHLGGESDLTEIYAEIDGHKRCQMNPNWKAKIRQVLQQFDCFQSSQRGEWRLVAM